MTEDDPGPPRLGDVLELGNRSFIFDGQVWQPSVSPAGQALIRQLGEPRGSLQATAVPGPTGYPQGWPMQVVVAPPDYERQAKTFITVWLKYVLLIMSVGAAAVVIVLLISGGVFATLMGALFSR